MGERKEILREGVLDVNTNMFIAKGAVKLPDKPIPIAFRYKHDELIIGEATNFQRDDETGAITAEFQINSGIEDIEAEFSAGWDVNHALWSYGKTLYKVNDGL